MFVITSHTHPHIYSGFKSQNLFTWGLPDETESFWVRQEPLGFNITALVSIFSATVTADLDWLYG